MKGTTRLLAAALCCLASTGCQSPKERTLESVAKEWCQTIRASQVMPVYPLTEDLEPGDVFVVQTSLARQNEIWNERGFLPLDQPVVRLPVATANRSDGKGEGRVEGLRYDNIYRHAVLESAFGGKPIARPGWSAESTGKIQLPRVAFPSYEFQIDRANGLKLALPISGIPVGLGILDSSKAVGTVEIRDAYTYGIDIASLYTSLLSWWDHNPKIQHTLRSVVRNTDSEVYLRAVNRVFLTNGVSVSLFSLDATSGGVDAAAAQPLETLDLSGADPESVEATVTAFGKAREAVLTALNTARPGGSVRFTHASRRSVSMDETFVCPLVIGYLGFDVKVLPDGSLSTPIPSYTTVSEQPKFAAIQELNQTLTLVSMTDEARAALFVRAAKLHDDPTFRTMFETRLRETSDPQSAFHFALNDYIAHGSEAESDARTSSVNLALTRALANP